MSEKHLTEAAWKQLAAKQGIKDIGLGKSLIAYNAIDVVKAPSEAFEALQQIAVLSTKLKKANQAKPDLVAYLDEILKEVKKSTPAIQARVKAVTATTAAEEGPESASASKTAATEGPEEGEDEEEKEAAEFRKDLKQRLTAALAQVKARAPSDPEQQAEPKPQLKFMAYLASKSCSVLVAARVGSATKKLLPEIAGGTTGGKYFQGECIFERNSYTFVLEEVPSGLAQKLASALLTETGQKYKVRARSLDGSVTLDSDTDVDVEATPGSLPAPPVVDAAQEMARFIARFKALQPGLVKAIAGKIPEADGAKKRAAEAGAFANKKEFDPANRALDEVEKFLRNAPAPAASPAADVKKPPGPEAPSPEKSQAAPREIKLSTYLNGRANLRKAKQAAAQELERLRGSILSLCQGQPFLAQLESKTERLLHFLDPIDDSLINTLDEASKCSDAELQPALNKKVLDTIQKQLAALHSHPLAAFVKQNPFGSFNVTQPLEQTLAELDAKLRA